MSRLVDAADIERIVSKARHATEHFGRAVSKDQTFYIMHSADCLLNVGDLRDCVFSLALDQGITIDEWAEDVTYVLNVQDGELTIG